MAFVNYGGRVIDGSGDFAEVKLNKTNLSHTIAFKIDALLCSNSKLTRSLQFIKHVYLIIKGKFRVFMFKLIVI